ncbi:MAG TPA: penicillin-binding protein [Bryobacteraceae bacterium]|nr:penicillin-binding protein [Bryobacteraceae bacterium]
MDRLAIRRVHLLVRVTFLWAALIGARLIQLQVVQHRHYAQLASDQQQQVEEIKAPRGAILDRYGDRLAMSLPAESVCVDPLRVPDFAVASDILAKILNLDGKDLLEKMKSSAADRRGFLWVKRKITREEAQRLRELNLDWIEFRTENQRFYPNRTLAAHVIGSVDFAQNGNGGIEQSLNDELEGHPGEMLVTEDVQRRGFASRVERQPQPGKDIRLTIDSRIQFVAEQELAKMVELHHGRTGSLVAMDPRNGDILAMANYPTFDPNEPPQPGHLSARENLAISAPFEPGSVYKVITLSAALETTKLRPESIINCGNGSINLFGRIIHDHSSYASLSMADVLARSSNIGAINIGLQVGDQNLYDYIRRFGFGRKTGVPLPGESSGMVRPLRVWSKSSIGSVAMGQEIGVTSLQLAQACAVIASGGLLIRPRLLMDAPVAAPVRVLRPETAITMRSMMEGVVIKPYGTGYRYARLLGYTSAGKTGTAQIYDYRLHEYTHTYNASFMGFAPVTNPRIVVIATINGTEGTFGYGGPSSGPVFREVASAGLRVMDVPKDLPEMVPPEGGGRADENDVAIADLSSIPPPLVQADNADATDDRPAASASNALDQRVLFSPDGANGAPQQDLSGPRVPNFQGKTVRNVIQQAAALGIPVEFTGSGVARAQAPEPGMILPLGSSVRVLFGR